MSNSSIISQTTKQNQCVMTELLAANTISMSTTSTLVTDGTTSMSVSITPSSASSKILILVTVHMLSTTGNFRGYILKRNGSNLFVGDSAGSRVQVTHSGYVYNSGVTSAANHFSYLDSPGSTSTQTYTVDVVSSAAITGYVNRGSTDTDTSSSYRLSSRIIALEVLP